MPYAANTDVTPDRSRAEIERTLERYGATAFAYAWDKNSARVGFTIKGLDVAMTLPMPERRQFTRTPTGRDRTESAIDTEHRQAQRQRWRALALVIKAKLEAIDSGISTVEREFLPDIMLPGLGGTVGEFVAPHIAKAYIEAGRQLPPGRHA